ncbi:MAG: N-methyl-L-tryptophan oxidase [Bacteroidota bacterium]|nr:N-methyl-L-tryptophan oxidase [Bacteroidota bacterium]
MNPPVYDVIVVGLGAAGSAALYHLARRNVRALGLDRYFPPHIHGSTHNESRIIRKAYFEGAEYGPLLDRAYELWAELEQTTGQQLTAFCGCLNIGPRDSDLVMKAESTAARHGLDLERLSPAELHARYPGYRIPEDCVAVLETAAGCIRPEPCVATQLRLARDLGAECRLGEPVRSWTGDTGDVVAVTDAGTYVAHSVILTAGAWIGELASVPVQVERVTNTWFAPANPLYGPDLCPAFIYEDAEGVHSYGCPDLGRGVKVGLHHVGPLFDHPDEVCRKPMAEDETGARQVIRQLMPQADDTRLHSRVCLYTNTPDKHFLIDYLSGVNRQVVVGSACSGHGFKMSSSVGEALAALALHETPRVDVSPFCWRWP